MKDSSHIRNNNPLKIKGEEGLSAALGNQPTRRAFVQAAGLGVAAVAAQGVANGAEKIVDKYGNPVQGFEENIAASTASSKGWEPVSERKIRVGLVGYGFCQFGAAFGFQDHPNVEVVAVSDLFPDRRDGVAKACRCNKA